MPPSRLVSRNVVAERGRTSMRLEPELWEAVHEICAREGINVGDLVQHAERTSTAQAGRTSAVRTYALSYFRTAATAEGHARAGHGKLGQDHRVHGGQDAS